MSLGVMLRLALGREPILGDVLCVRVCIRVC